MTPDLRDANDVRRMALAALAYLENALDGVATPPVKDEAELEKILADFMEMSRDVARWANSARVEAFWRSVEQAKAGATVAGPR